MSDALEPPDPSRIAAVRTGARDRRSIALARLQWQNAERRRTYLLRDVELPLSYDRYVLPPPDADGSDAGEIRLIAGVILPDAGAPNLVAWLMGEPIVELDAPEEWTFLGYDVCDSFGYSGLVNCGYKPVEREELARAWNSRLNEHHLLRNLADADAFRVLTDARVPEHAPFLVHALFVAREALR